MQNEKRPFADVLEGSTDAGLRRGRPDLRHRRLRHRAQARAADQPRFRNKASPSTRSTSKGSSRSRRPISRRPIASATGSSCSASQRKPKAASKRACRRRSSIRISAIAEVSGVTNAVAIDGDFSGNILLVGAGRRGQADSFGRRRRHPRHRARPRRPALRHAERQAQGRTSAPSSTSTTDLITCASRSTTSPAPWPALPSAWATAAFARKHRAASPANAAHSGTAPQPAKDKAQPVIIITHETTEEAMRKALETIEKDGNVTERPQMIRIEEL